MSAISMSSIEEGPSPNLSASTDSTIRERLAASPAHSLQSYQGSPSSAPPRPGQQPSRGSSDREIPSSSRINGNGSSSSKPPSAPTFKRPRTYSQPFASDTPPVPNVNINGNAYPKINGTHTNYSLPTSDSPVSRPNLNPPEPKPTRIPKVARGRSGSTSSHGHPSLPTNYNGYNHNHSPYSTPSSPDANQFPELGVVRESSYRNSNASRSTVSVPSRRHSGILNEPPPFIPGSINSSAAQSQYGQSQSNNSQGHDDNESPPRHSNDSEERPFEHWYRGEVSRNGGVGELRVGKRMEMLDIANYGHTLKNKVFDTRIPAPSVVGEGGKRRKRAGSVSGIGTREVDRGSLYLDEERAREVGRVLDESPLTDLEGEGEWSDIGSSEHYSAIRNFNYMGAGDVSTASAPPLAYNRSTTPTPSTLHKPSSRQQNAPPTRIPGPAPRQSSEPPRMPTPTLMHRGASEPPLSFPSSSSSPPSPSIPSRRQQQPQKQQSKSTPPHTPSTSKRPQAPPSASTPAKKSRTNASKATRAKTLATRKQMEEQANRRSVAYYPTPGGGEDIMDAIPSWTQPVPREGNWDEVRLHLLLFASFYACGCTHPFTRPNAILLWPVYFTGRSPSSGTQKGSQWALRASKWEPPGQEGG